MNFKQLGIGSLIGVLAALVPLWIFFEGRVEKRVRYEVQVAGLKKDHEAQSAKLEELEKEMDGDIWTMQRQIESLVREVAVMHARDSQ